MTESNAGWTDGPSDLPGDRHPGDVDLVRVWVGVAAEVWRRRPGVVERLAARLTGSPGLARALVTTPSLLLAWVIASGVVLASGALATVGTGTAYVALLAPALAANGIAYAYGPGIDPAWELSQSTAVGDRMVLLTRVLAVFGRNAALGLVASAASGVAAAVRFGWLVPMTAVSALALAATTLARSANVGVADGRPIRSISSLLARFRVEIRGVPDPSSARSQEDSGMRMVIESQDTPTTAGGSRQRQPW